MAKIKKYLAFLLIAVIFICISYVLVYKLSILPYGYDLEEVEKDYVSVKSYNLIGLEKELIVKSFTEDEAWKIFEIEYEVNRQKEFLWLLFSAGLISLFLFIYKKLNGAKFWEAVFSSNIIIAILLPIIPVIRSVNRIVDLISN